MDGSPANARACVEGSLRRLSIDCIDVFTMRGPVDPKVPLDETMGELKVGREGIGWGGEVCVVCGVCGHGGQGAGARGGLGWVGGWAREMPSPFFQSLRETSSSSSAVCCSCCAVWLHSAAGLAALLPGAGACRAHRG